jgi:hypothetical protein
VLGCEGLAELFGLDMARTVSGRLQRERTLNERILADDWRFTKVYVQRDDRWQVVAFHCSEPGQPL